jgi:DNA-binding response OmpR family regulator
MEFAFPDLYKNIEQEKITIDQRATLNNVVYAGMLALLVAAFLLWRFRKNLRPTLAQNQNHVKIKELSPELPALGKFLFDAKGQHLFLGDEVISLTDKECKVLDLLHRSFGELIPRETLMQEVWINEGVITGRSLDMFVSKLRKKLSRDPVLKITNVHGKGYKLETS